MDPIPPIIRKDEQVHNQNIEQQLSVEERERLQWFTALEQAFPAMYHRLRNLLAAYAHDIHPELDSAGYVLLVQIRHRAPVRAAQLVEYINIDKSAISRQVRLLLDLKLIDRLADPDDSRAQLLTVTDEGARLIDQLQNTRLQSFQAAFPRIAELLEVVFEHIVEDNKVS